MIGAPCAMGCIAADPGHPGACIDINGAPIETALTSRDPDAPRALKQAQPDPVIWGLPFYCPDCMAWGYVAVCVENERKTTDEQVEYFMGKKHRALSPGCARPADRLEMGRLRRRDKATGQMIFMLKKGETEETPIDRKWPPWTLS